MRTLRALILEWLTPTRATHNTEPEEVAVSPMRPTPATPAGHEAPPRPYLIHWEWEKEPRLQHERTRAAALAAMGQDHRPAKASA